MKPVYLVQLSAEEILNLSYMDSVYSACNLFLAQVTTQSSTSVGSKS